MKKNNGLVFWPTFLFPIIQMFVSNEVFWIIGFICFCYIIIIKCKLKFAVPFAEYKMLFVFFIWGAVIGLLHFLVNDIDLRDYVRDVFYYSTPIIYIFLGSWYAEEESDPSKIYNSFIASGAVVALISLYRMYVATGFFAVVSNVHEWRSSTSGGAIIIGVSLALAFSGIIPKEKSLPNALKIACVSVSSLFFLLSLSRTNLFIVAIMYLILTLRKENAKKVLSRFVLFLAAVIGGLWLMTTIMPENLLKEYGQKILSSLTEISSNNSWTNAATVQDNWRGYENYCAVEQWKKTRLFTQVFGAGFGKRIYVGSYAYALLGQLFSDGTPANAIAVLHNGYATQLIKLGVLGVFLYVIFYLRLIQKGFVGCKSADRQKADISRGLLAVSTCLLIQTLFLNGLFRDYCYYPLITLVGYTAHGAILSDN